MFAIATRFPKNLLSVVFGEMHHFPLSLQRDEDGERRQPLSASESRPFPVDNFSYKLASWPRANFESGVAVSNSGTTLCHIS